MRLPLPICALVFVQAALGQPERTAREGGAGVQRQLDAARTRAFSLPAELGADYLYETGSRFPLTRDQRIELVRQILEMARQAEHPVPLDFVGGINADSVAARTVAASGQGLDHASLTGRALILLGPASADITREALDELLRLRLPDTGCEACFSPDPRVIYTTFAKEIVHAYSPEERREERHLDLIRRAVLSMHSPAQIHGIATLLTALDLTAAQRQSLIGLFGGALQAIPRNDRAFAKAMSSGTVFNSVLALADLAPAQSAFANQWRDYVNAASPLNACRDFWSGAIVQRIAEGFQRAFSEGRKDAQVRPLTEWTKPDQLTACQSSPFQLRETDQIYRELGRLAPLFGEGPASELERDALVRQFDNTASKLAALGCDNRADSRACLHRTFAALTRILDVAPDDVRRRTVLGVGVAKFAQMRYLERSFTYWLAYASDFLSRVSAVDRPFVTAKIRETGDDAFLAAAELRYKIHGN